MDIDIPAEAIAKYLERRHKDLEGCRAALQSGDLFFIERVGHQIKGNALTFGFEDLAPIGIAMELLAKQKDLVNLRPVIDQFESFLKTVVASKDQANL